jgi:pyruvate kinase
VATIGPASRDPALLRVLLEEGVDVCRINCSHSTAESIRSDVARIRRAASELGRNAGILLDLQGPKIRTGRIDPPLQLDSGDLLTVVMDSDLAGEGLRIGTTWTRMHQDVMPGEAVLFADGALGGVVHEVRPAGDGPAEVDIRMNQGGSLGSHKGINLPESQIQAPALTEKDRKDLVVGVHAGVDFVALSFVRSADDIEVLRKALSEIGHAELPIIAKIEKPEAVANIEEILCRVEGIMVARGDLGVELPFEQVPVIQKQLISAANRSGKLVITATQMLDSMERNPRPTRAETTDVANAILDGTDAVMLSGETAAGKFPLQSVQVMDRIAQHVENSPLFVLPGLDQLPRQSTVESAVLRAASVAAREGNRPMVVFTWSGSTAIRASKGRPVNGVYAVTHDQTVADMLTMAWGVSALRIPTIKGTDELIGAGERALMDAGWLDADIEVVLLAGRSPMRGATNMMKVEIVNGQSDP